MDEDREDNVRPGDGSPSILGLVLALFVLTVLAGAGGGAFALMQVRTIEEVAEKRANEVPEKADDALAWREESAVADLEPVIANLASPASVWIRLDTAIVFDKDAVGDLERLSAEVEQDVLLFARTLTLGELQGASALNHLRADLNERVALATGGAVEELIIKTMVLQ